MIIRDRMGATMLLDPSRANDVHAREASAEQIAKRIVRDGEGIGAFIRITSVWFSQRPDPAGLGELIDGVWSPDPDEGVILLGGPLDGSDDARMPRGDDGLPPLTVTVPTSADTAERRRLVGEYVRAGIDSERDRWVYEFVSMG